MLRALLIVAVLGAAPFAAQTIARAADAPPATAGSVVVVGLDGAASAPLALADLADRFDVADARYAVRAADGSTQTVAVASGISLGALLQAANVDPAGTTYAEVTRDDGSAVIVARDQIDNGSADGPPVVWTDASGAVRFLRPSDDEEDVNAGDLVAPADGVVRVTLRSDEPFGVRIRASALRVRPGQRVDFTASLTHGDGAPTFSWYFDDGRSATGADVSHRFRRADTYTVLLSAQLAGQASEAIAVATVRVRAPGDADGDGAARGAGTGGQGGGGAGAGSAGGGTGGGTGSATGGSGAAGAGAPPAAPDPPVAPAPEPAPERRAPARTDAPEPQGELVEGVLIASSEPLPTGAAGASDAASGLRDGPLELPTAVWTVLGVLLLLGAGWALERRHTHAFWQDMG